MADNEKRVAETRRKLGLPPAAPRKDSAQPTYVEALESIVKDALATTRARPDQIAPLIDFAKPPRELIERLTEHKLLLEKKPVTVWGIETPRLLPVQYGGFDYKIPSSFLATALAVALAPLLVGWLGSVYVTRQRELLMISGIEDYKLAFPHILNFLPVVFDRLTERLGSYQSPRTRWALRIVERISSSFVRSLVILLFAAPMAGAFSYSVFVLWSGQGEPVSLEFAIGGAVAIVISVQSLALVIQEWIVLHGKEFYV